MIINKKGFSQIRRVQKDSQKKKRYSQKEEILIDDHKLFIQLKIGACKLRKFGKK